MTKYFQYNSPVILSFFFLSFLALILNWITRGSTNRLLFSTGRASLLNPFTYVQFITHIFGHKNWNHFMNNFLLILLIGPMIEEKYGSINLLIMIAITASVTGIINFIIGKYRLLGASGIVYMLIMLSSLTNIQSGKIPLTLVLICIFYIVNEIILGFFKKDNISHLGHLIGAICGFLCGIYLL